MGSGEAGLRLDGLDAYLEGVLLEEQRNQAASGDADIGAAGSPVATLVITSREDIEIARQVRAVLDG